MANKVVSPCISFWASLAALSILGVTSLLLWWSTCCLVVWRRVLPIDASALWWYRWHLSLLSAAGSRCYSFGQRSVMSSISHSTILCATAGASMWAVVSTVAAVSHHRVTYSLRTFLLIFVPALQLLMMLSTLPKAAHPTAMRLLISPWHKVSSSRHYLAKIAYFLYLLNDCFTGGDCNLVGVVAQHDLGLPQV